MIKGALGIIKKELKRREIKENELDGKL